MASAAAKPAQVGFGSTGDPDSRRGVAPEARLERADAL